MGDDKVFEKQSAVMKGSFLQRAAGAHDQETRGFDPNREGNRFWNNGYCACNASETPFTQRQPMRGGE
ncbi:MAG: hypothetical protein P8Y53_20305, partial [Pseudolabrys sp.]